MTDEIVYRGSIEGINGIKHSIKFFHENNDIDNPKWKSAVTAGIITIKIGDKVHKFAPYKTKQALTIREVY